MFTGLPVWCWHVYRTTRVALACLQGYQLGTGMFTGLPEWHWHVYRATSVALACLPGYQRGTGMFTGLPAWHWHVYRATSVALACLQGYQGGTGMFTGLPAWHWHVFRATSVALACLQGYQHGVETDRGTDEGGAVAERGYIESEYYAVCGLFFAYEDSCRFFCFFSSVEISLCTPIPLFLPGSVCSCSAS